MDASREYEYPFDKFLEHFHAIESTATNEKEAFYNVNKKYGPGFTIQEFLGLVFEYMSTVYNDEEEASAITCHYVQIMWHIFDKMPIYDQKDYAIMGSKASGSAVSLHLLKAVHKTVLELHNSDDDDEFNVDQIMKLADEFIEVSDDCD